MATKIFELIALASAILIFGIFTSPSAAKAVAAATAGAGVLSFGEDSPQNPKVLQFAMKGAAADQTTGANSGNTPVEEEGDSTQEGQHHFNPSVWTPVIILMLFLTVIIIIGAPSLIDRMLKKRNELKGSERKRKFTITLTFEPNGFTKMQPDSDI